MTSISTQRTQRPVSQRTSSQAPAFIAGEGKAVKLGGVSMHEAKLTPAAKKNETALIKEAGGDGPALSAWKLSSADAKALLGNPAQLRAVLFQAMTGMDPKGADNVDMFDKGKSTEVKVVDRKAGYVELRKVFGGEDEEKPTGPDALGAAVRSSLPAFMGSADTKLMRVIQHDNGYGYYWGFAALNAKSGELHLAVNVNAP